MPISTAPLERVASHRMTSPAIARRTDAGLATGTLVLFTIAALAVPGLVRASPDAAALHGENCVSCHGTEVYTREDRRVQSREALATQVRMCEQNLGLTWFDDDVDAVTRLLNQNYYKFD